MVEEVLELLDETKFKEWLYGKKNPLEDLGNPYIGDICPLHTYIKEESNIETRFLYEGVFIEDMDYTVIDSFFTSLQMKMVSFSIRNYKPHLNVQDVRVVYESMV